MTTPRVILGTMTFGGQTSQADATTMLLDFCHRETDIVGTKPQVDTAIMYQNGQTEQVLGRILQEQHPPLQCSISSKANPFTAEKNLSPSGVRSQLEASLQALQRDSVDIYYLHAPDARYEIEPTLEEIQTLYSQGKLQRFGLSNFTAWETVYIHNYMASKGYVVPTIYQGMYNAITRQVETELFPALRKLNISFYAYNPLAGGMLSGKYTPAANDDELQEANSHKGRRFSGNTFWAKRYRERFQQKEQFEALEIIESAIDVVDNMTMANASLRWLRHHSKLRKDDGIIVGASTISHCNANMESLAMGPLPDHVVKAFNEAARLCQGVCPDYARGYSGSSAEKDELV